MFLRTTRPGPLDDSAERQEITRYNLESQQFLGNKSRLKEQPGIQDVTGHITPEFRPAS